MAKKTVIDSLRHSALETSIAVAAATTGLAGCSPSPEPPASASPAISATTTAPATAAGNKYDNIALDDGMRKLADAASRGAAFDETLAKGMLAKAVDEYAHARFDIKADMRENGISYYKKVLPGNKEGTTSSVVIINPHYKSLAVFNNMQYAGIEDPVMDMSNAKRVGAIAQDPTQHIEQTYAETAAILQQRNESAAAQHIRDSITHTRDIAKLPQRYIDMLAGDKEAMKAFTIGSGVSADFTVTPLLNSFVQSYTAPVAIRREGDELVARVQDMEKHTWSDAGKVSITPKAKGFGDRVNESRTPQKEQGR